MSEMESMAVATVRKGSRPTPQRQMMLWVSNRMRRKRNGALVALIDRLHAELGRPVRVLDVGGSYVFWETVPNRPLCDLTMVNLPEALAHSDYLPGNTSHPARLLAGDARDLSHLDEGPFDLVVCNSVIEHVGSWADMERAAKEVRRMGMRGWVQVPAYGFPIEQHTLLPFIHWFGHPTQIWLLRLFKRGFADLDLPRQRMECFHINLPTRREMEHLFPGCTLSVERFLGFPKSYVIVW